MTQSETDRWIPVRDGDIYCSPACGGKCTKKKFDIATREAQRLAAQLGKGWEPHVWENLGWHYEVRCGGMTVDRRDKTWYVQCRVGDRTFGESSEYLKYAFLRIKYRLEDLADSIDAAQNVIHNANFEGGL